MHYCLALISNVTLTTVLTTAPLFDIQANSHLTILDLHIGTGNPDLQVIRAGKSRVDIIGQRLVRVRLESWVDCIKSTIRVEAAEIRESQADVLFGLYAGCDLVVSDSRITDFIGQIGESRDSEITLNNTILQRISSDSALFQLELSHFYMQNTAVDNFISAPSSNFLSAKANSSVFLNFSTFHNLNLTDNGAFFSLSACEIQINEVIYREFHRDIYHCKTNKCVFSSL
jgi:hypothetical protein